MTKKTDKKAPADAAAPIDRIEMTRPWRQPGRLWHPGRYFVPRDMSEDQARQAIAEKAATDPSQPAEPAPAPKTEPGGERRSRRAKGPAPENKAKQPDADPGEDTAPEKDAEKDADGDADPDGGQASLV